MLSLKCDVADAVCRGEKKIYKMKIAKAGLKQRNELKCLNLNTLLDTFLKVTKLFDGMAMKINLHPSSIVTIFMKSL